MRFEHNATFHAVGQGLFHSARLVLNGTPFSYVYDCGNTHPGRHLWAAIAALKESKTLDDDGLTYILLSHLHWDHVSGVNALLEVAKSVQVAVLPYLCPAERAMALATAISDFDYRNNYPDWYPDFLKSPSRFLLQNGVKKVVFIRGRDQGGLERDQFSHPPTFQNDAVGVFEHWNGLDELNDEELDQIEYWEQAAEGDVDESGSWRSDAVTYRYSTGALGIGPWFFVFFNVARDVSALQAFVSLFDTIRGEKPLAELLRTDLKLEAVRGAYKRAFPKTNMNDLSLATFAGTLSSYSFQHSEFQMPMLWEGTKEDQFVGTLLTGDLPVNRMWPSFSQKFGITTHKWASTPIAYQVPHHGASSCWSVDQSLIRARAFIISAGSHNNYGHPRIEVLHDLLRHGNKVFWTTEEREFNYSFKSSESFEP